VLFQNRYIPTGVDSIDDAVGTLAQRVTVGHRGSRQYRSVANYRVVADVLVSMQQNRLLAGQTCEKLPRIVELKAFKCRLEY
jgi:hypothetical protein